MAARRVGGRFDVTANRDRLVDAYGALYAQARVDTLDALDSVGQLTGADELKSKLLFSVVVVSRTVARGNLIRSFLQFSSKIKSLYLKPNLGCKCSKIVVENFEKWLRPIFLFSFE